MAANEDLIKPYLDTFKDEQVKLRFKFALQALQRANQTTSVNTLNFYLERLDDTDEVLIRLMDEKQLIALKRQLLITYYLMLQNNEDYEKYISQIKRCEQLIDHVTLKLNHNEIRAQELAFTSTERPVAYCGIEVGQWFGRRIVEVLSDKSAALVQWMTSVNEKRLYWVWGGGLLRTIIANIPPQSLNTSTLNSMTNAPNQFTGYMSWVLYYTRFALNAFLLFKETFAPALTAEEALSKTPYWDRFKTQWNIRKFTLLNDSIWGIANMVCFFWCTGSGGDLLTIALLGFDLFIALWDFEEQKTLHNEKMADYAKQLASFEGNMLEQKRIQKLINKESSDWENKKIGLMCNTAYALSLMLAFALYSLPFLPISGLALIITASIGAVLCFSLTVISNVAKGYLDLQTSRLVSKEAMIERNDKLEQFKELLKADGNISTADKIFLYLEIKQLTAESTYQKEMAIYHSMHLVRTLIIQSLIPAFMFVSFVFLPVGAGLGILAAVLALAVITNAIIENAYKKDEVSFPEFDNDEYELFCKDPDGLRSSSKSQVSLGLFKPEKDRDLDVGEDAPLLN